MAPAGLVKEGALNMARVEGSKVSELVPPSFSLVSQKNQSLLAINALTVHLSFIIQLAVPARPL